MQRAMRRSKQLLTDEEAVAMLAGATSGVLAVVSDDGYPYAVPLSFAYDEGRLYFHSAVEGHKLEAIGHCNKASFCVIADDEVVQSTFTTHYRSVVVFGHVRVLEDAAEKRHALMCLAHKYSPDYVDSAGAEIDGAWSRTCALELKIERMTGKASMEIIKERTGD